MKSFIRKSSLQCVIACLLILASCSKDENGSSQITPNDPNAVSKSLVIANGTFVNGNPETRYLLLNEK